MSSFLTRLYGLSILNFFKYSVFIFFLLKKTITTLNLLKKQNFKISYLYNNSFTKKNQVFLIYHYVKTELFNINKIVNSLRTVNINKLTSLSYNNTYYNFNYFNNTIKAHYFSVISFFSIKKPLNSSYYLFSIRYFNNLISFFLIFFIKQLNYLFIKRINYNCTLL